MSAPSHELPQPKVDEIVLTDVLHALSDPIRLDMVRQLGDCRGEKSCGSFDVPIAKSTATHHWRVLRDAGVVSAREEGTRKYHRLRHDDLDRRFPGLLDSILAHAGAAATTGSAGPTGEKSVV
jgi:DNA-binding transcriptional ArsR family regulator